MLTKNEIKYIRLLKDKKHRDIENCYVVEGYKSLNEFLLVIPCNIEKIYATDEGLLKRAALSSNIPFSLITPVEMEKISFLTHPSSVLAIIKKTAPPTQELISDAWNLCLDGIQDPGNMGTIIRIADWFGLSQIWCSEDCADAFNPKVVQATMGSLARVNVGYTDLKMLFADTTLPVYASAMDGKDLFDIHVKYGVLVVGNEGKGIRDEILNLASYKVTIPRIGAAESLNAAVATGIMLSQLTSHPSKSRGH